jgi:hypothetical protein
MNKAILVGLCIAVAALFAGAGQAFAEFKSLEEKTTGKGEVYGLFVEGGGATVECMGVNPSTWAISNAKEAAKKGEILKISTEKWEGCIANSGEWKGAAKVTGCGMELKEPGSQTKVVGAITSACTISGPLSCEIKLVPESNKELKAIELAYADNENKDTFLEGGVTNAVTTVSAGCATVGIKATTVGKFTPVGVMAQINTEALKPLFTLTVPVRLTAAVPAGEGKIKNESGVAAMLADYTTTQTPAGNYLKIENEMTCRTKNYANNEECITKAKRDAAPPRVGMLKWRIVTSAGGVAELTTLIGV